MGTRGLYVAIKDGQPVIAQYGQWDAYPGGNGMTVLNFARQPKKVAALIANLPKLREATDADFSAAYAEAGITRTDGWVNMDEADRFKAAAPQLERGMCANIFEFVADFEGDVLPIKLEMGFGYDSLFCEYAYVLDLDARTFTAYEGFQEGRTASGLWATKPEDEDAEYYGVTPVATWSFDALPTDKKFSAAFEKEDAIV